MTVDKKFIEIRVSERNGQKYEWIHSDNSNTKVNCCPFCESRTFSGSWTCETCPKCGAVEFIGAWSRDIIEEIEKGEK